MKKIHPCRKMQTFLVKISLMCLGCVFFHSFLPVCAQIPKGKNHYEIGVLADRGKEKAVQQWMPFVNYLTAHVENTYFSIVPLNYDEIDVSVEAGKIDFVIANPLILIQLDYFNDIQRMASLKRVVRGQERLSYGGVVFVRSDFKDIVELEDLKGENFAAVHSQSYAGWILIAREIQKHGWKIEDFLSSVTFLKNQDSVVKKVLSGEFDVGMVRTGILEKMEDEGLISLKDFRVIDSEAHNIHPDILHSTDFHPEWSIAKLTHVSENLAKEVAEVLYKIPLDSQVGGAAEFSRWTIPYNYALVRKTIRDLRAHGNHISSFRSAILIVKDYWYLFLIFFCAVFYMVLITVHRSFLNKTLQRSKEILEKELLEHKRAEESLRESREMMELVLDLIPARVFWKDKDSRFMGCNKVFAEDAGLSGSRDVMGKTDYDMVWAEQADSYVENDQKVMNSGKPLLNVIESQTHVNGKRIWLRTHKVPMRNVNGDVVGVLGTYENITEAKEAQEALQKSEIKYRELVENANSFIVRLNAKGEIIFFNEFAQKFFGFSEEEILGKNMVGTIVPREDSEGRDLTVLMKDILEKVMNGEGGQYSVDENENIKKNGERVWVTWSNKVMINEEGEKELLSIGNDISERRKMEEELLRLSYALEQSQNIILITDTRGDIQYVNPKFTSITGYTRDEVIGKNPRLLKSGEMSHDVYTHIWNKILSGETWRGEFHNRKKNGELYWERATISPIKDRKGEISSFLAVKEDITNEKKLAQDLQKAFGRLKEMERIINLSNAIVFMWSPKGHDFSVKFVSDSIRTLGWEPEDFYVRGMRIQDFILEEDRDMVEELIKRNIRARRVEFSHQYRVKTIDKKIRWLEDHSFVTYAKNGEPEYIQGIAFDVTDRRISEERMLEAVNMKSEFISIVSHELRTPLTAVKESINIVAEEETGALNDGQKKFIGIAKRNVDRLGKLINDVLDYQKLDMGKLNFELRDVDVCPLISEVLKTMEIVASNKGLILEMKIPAEGAPKVKADSDRIIQVLNNLINNAIKFTNVGIIIVEVVKSPDNVQVLVSDTGIGIKAQDMHKLFQTFSQVRMGTERRSGETGLGLAISKKIIDSHGGSIWAESVYGKGTTVTFTLPVSV